MQILLSNKAFQDFNNNPTQVGDCLRTLNKALNTVPNFNNLQRHHGIKRLKHVKPSAWRHRFGDWRTVFTITRTEPDYTFAIHRCALRRSVYRDMPQHIQRGLDNNFIDVTDIDDQFEKSLEDDAIEIESLDDQFSSYDRYYFLPKELLNNEVGLEDLISFVATGHYLRVPCLSKEQQEICSQDFHSRPNIYTMQGAAGTGKTTLAIHLALEAVDQGLFPIIILPNQNLVRIGIDSLIAFNSKLKVHSNFTDTEQADLAVFTRDDLIHQLSGDSERLLSSRLANQEVHKIVHRNIRKKYSMIKDLNLYHLYCGFIGEHSYGVSTRDALSQGYIEALKFLEMYSEKISESLNGKDFISQAQRASNNLERQQTQLHDFAGDRSFLTIIDEVQDYYWTQLLVLLKLSQTNNLQAPAFLLGDENQRVTLSGFSWATLAQRIKQSFNCVPQKILLPSKNYRNTTSISNAANFILLNAFDRKQYALKARHFPQPSQPENCFDIGVLPRLIQVDSDWFKSLLQELSHKFIDQDNSTRYVFIVRDEDLQDDLINKVSQDNQSQAVIYTVTEAKGQEFDAAILVFPFRLKKNQLSVDDLYDWYTSFTRARHYLALLATESEFKWLKNQLISEESLNNIFHISQPLRPHEFAEQIQAEAQTTITEEQSRERILDILVRQIFSCATSDSRPRDFKRDRYKLKLSIWTLVEQVYQGSEKLSQSDKAMQVGNQLASKRPYLKSVFNDLILYAGSVQFFSAEALNEWEDSLVSKLEAVFRKKPEIREDALKQTLNPFLRVLILRAAAYSWDAAKASLKTRDKARLIRGITRDLERRSLGFESVRMKSQFLNEKSEYKLFLPELLSYKGSLIDGLCEEFTKSLNPLLESK